MWMRPVGYGRLASACMRTTHRHGLYAPGMTHAAAAGVVLQLLALLLLLPTAVEALRGVRVTRPEAGA